MTMPALLMSTSSDPRVVAFRQQPSPRLVPEALVRPCDQSRCHRSVLPGGPTARSLRLQQHHGNHAVRGPLLVNLVAVVVVVDTAPELVALGSFGDPYPDPHP